MAENFIVSHPEAVEKFRQSVAKGGISSLHVISDFDRTLTTAFVDGKEVPSLMSVLRDGSYLTKDYAQKAHDLFRKYHPVEVNPDIPFEEKKKAMHEWWTSHFDLLIKTGLTKKVVESIVELEKVRLRPGAPEFLELLHKQNIPLVILSASGLGGDAIALYLKKKNLLYDNTHIISNFYVWDNDGRAIGVKEPIIHVLNKDEAAIKDFPAYKAIKDRKNAMLLGDNIEDISMARAVDHDSLLKIGFLNNDVGKYLAKYKSAFDLLVLNDSGMEPVNEFLKEIKSLRA